MRTAIRVTAAAAVAAAAVASAATPAFASAASPAGTADGHAVFVQTDNTNGNRVVAYDRAADGTLTPAGSYATGGRGGILAGSVVDHTASQGSLTYDPPHGLLYAVNAGSNTISVFAVRGDRLALRQVLGSGGTFPVSVTVHGDLVYVLNALNGGSVQGYRVLGSFLVRMPGSHRALGLDPNATPQFTTTPGQVAFTPDGTQLVVTTKGNGNDIDVFGIGFGGLPSARATVNAEPGTVPFAINFDPFGHLVIAEAGTNALSAFQLSRSGTVSLLDRTPTGQAATCWVATAGSFLFASNAGSPSESGFTSSAGGQLSLLGNTATDPGAVDAASAAGGRFLYVQTGGNGGVDEFSVAANGALAKIGVVTVPGAVGGEGIVATLLSPPDPPQMITRRAGRGPRSGSRPARPILSVMDPDSELLQRLRSGDERAFTSLVERYHEPMLRLAASFVPSRAVAEEVVQDTWLAALRGLETFEGRSSLKTWLFRILVNRARTTGTKEQRSVPVADPEPAVDPSRFGGDGGWADPPEHWIEAAESRMEAGKLADRIRAWIGELPARQREVVLLRDVERLSSEEVCAVLALSEGNQRVLLHRGRSRLRQLFENEFREVR